MIPIIKQLVEKGKSCMTPEELKTRIAARKKREREEFERQEKIREQNEKEQYERTHALDEDIRNDIEMRKILGMEEIKIKDKFLTDCFKHHFGFFQRRIRGTLNCLGWENGGACGEWDVVYHPDSYPSVTVEHRGKDVRRPATWETVKNFCDRFEKFHKEFNEWLETI